MMSVNYIISKRRNIIGKGMKNSVRSKGLLEKKRKSKKNVMQKIGKELWNSF